MFLTAALLSFAPVQDAPQDSHAGDLETITEQLLAERGVTDDDAVPFLIDLICLNVINQDKQADLDDEARDALDKLGILFLGRLSAHMNDDKYRTYAVATLAEEKVDEAGEEDRPILTWMCRTQLQAARLASLGIIEQIAEVASEKQADNGAAGQSRVAED